LARKEDPTHEESTTVGAYPGSDSLRLIVEEALEAKARDLLGRDHYERRSEANRGYRNGSRESTLRTGEGEVRFAG
jgi:transposase-like protein